MAVSVFEGKTSGYLAEVDSTWSSLRVTPRPVDYGGGGYYRATSISGDFTTLAAGGIVWAFRWTSATLYALIYNLRWTWYTKTAFTTSQVVDHAAWVVRGFTGADTGGSTLTLSSANNQKRTSMAASAVQEIRYSTTAVLSAGTRTVDPQPFMYRAGWSSAMSTGLTDTQPLDCKMRQEGPLVLSQNEGVEITNVTLMGAAGIIKFSVECAWAEIPVANF